MANGTLVLQSHRLPLPAPWLARCMASVREWAGRGGYDYRFDDDVLLQRLPVDLLDKTAHQLVVAADLARLRAMESALAEGYARVVWLDADTLVVDPARLILHEADYAVGREVWIQTDARSGRLRAYVKVHNAFLQFAQGNPLLAFYRHAAESIVRAHSGPMVPQLVGPKLLTALHNLVGFPVVESAGVLCPLVARELLGDEGSALALFRRHSTITPASLNLCGSLIEGDLGLDQVQRLVDMLPRMSNH